MDRLSKRSGKHPNMWWVASSIGVQIAATAYFLFDSISDAFAAGAGRFTYEVVIEAITAIALLAGIFFGILEVGHLRAIGQQQEAALGIARGGLADHLQLRFREWGLSGAEADVALFSLKGFQVAEIAKLRGSAPGTVRSQLSQVYTKAGVTSQSSLMALFFSDLIDGSPLAG